MSRYLVGQEPPADIVKRYVEANALLLADTVQRPELAVIDFVRRHPRSVAYLDAAAALIRPRSLLRKKLLLLLALLEASPQFTEFFLPVEQSVSRTVLRLTAHAASFAVKLMIGGFIYPIAVRAR
jgi:hypothetical protein